MAAQIKADKPFRAEKRFRNGPRDMSNVVFLAPFSLLFIIFIGLPIMIAIALSFTYFNGISTPTFAGFQNYLTMLTQDRIFMANVLPNTLQFAVFIGPGALLFQFLIAWLLAQLTHRLRTVLALIFYLPSLTGGVALAVIWKIIFSGDRLGYLNYILMSLGITNAPVAWLTDRYLLAIMIIVTLWSSMGIGFLSLLMGILNINPELYDAGYVDGIRSRFQELIYITLPSMKSQLMFAAVMQIVATFSAGQIGSDLTGSAVTPSYSGATFVTHINDHGTLQYEMGYAAALSVVLLLIIFGVSRIVNHFLVEK